MLGSYYIDIRPVGVEGNQSISEAFCFCFMPPTIETNVHILNSIGKTSPYTPVFVEPMMRFAYVVMHGKRVKYRIINVSRKPTVAHCPLEGAIQVYKQNLAQISEYRQRNHSILEDCREARYG